MRHVYLDHAAASPLDPAVLETMHPFLTDRFANPSSFHMDGKVVRDAVEAARQQIAKVLHVRADEVLFTSGGTESDNLAILGYARANKAKGNHLVTTALEHQAVLEAMYHLQKKEGFELTVIAPEKNGVVDAHKVLEAVREETLLVSVMLANNEIGTIQPVEEIGNALTKMRRDKKTAAVLHTDACQAPEYLELDVTKLHVDLLTLNGSKMYGPKGIGCLFVQRGLKLQPLQFGGSQERGIRPGTEHVAGIIGMAAALEIAQTSRQKESDRLSVLRDSFIEKILASIPKTRLNGDAKQRLPNNVNISFMDIEGEALLLYLDAQGVYASTGSACTSASLDPSHVILSMGLPYEVAHGSIRFSLGRSTTQEDVDYVLSVLPSVVEKLRAISPVNVDEKYYA